MTSESKEVDPAKELTTTIEEHEEDDSGPDEEAVDGAPESSTTDKKKKKKKSKGKKIKDAITGKSGEASEPKTAASLSNSQFEQLLALNPALRNELGSMDQTKLREMMKKISLADTLTGLASAGGQKDMASHKFWQTQPVPSFEDAKAKLEDEGPLREVDLDRVPKEPPPMIEGFEWVTMNLDDKQELQEVFELLSNHYVEDSDAAFRFHYSASFLSWALKSPGWKKEWHVGVRASKSRKLVAFISAIPIDMRVRKNSLKSTEVNFLCIHKKLRNKRLTPVLIKEITRRIHLTGVFQSIYTGGVLLPTPVATCRYYHRSLDWQKLHDVGFSPLPIGSTPLRQVAKFKLPEKTFLQGLRPMEEKDTLAVSKLLTRYLGRYDLGQIFSDTEVKHWLLHDDKLYPEQVIWTYVVEDQSIGKITDFVSFYRLASTVISAKKHQFVNAAYLYYYASETAFDDDKSKLKARLNALVKDALIIAKENNFDVMNALSLLENPLFLEEQHFGAGDGQLHYYLYNYRAAPIPGGLDKTNKASDKHMGGVGVVML